MERNYTSKRKPVGLLFDQWEINKEYHGMMRTLTETDCMMYEYLSGDHVDEPVYEIDENGNRTRKTYIAGMLTALLAGSSMTKTLVFDGTEIAHLGSTIKFTESVHVGDTLFTSIKPVEKRLSKSMPGAGIIKFEMTSRNQDGVTVMEEDFTMMIACTYEDAIKYNLSE